MEYVLKKCPHCGASYYFGSSRLGSLGSPIMTCDKCMGVIVDKDTVEPALSNLDEKAYSKQAYPLLIFILVFGTFLIIVGLFTESWPTWVIGGIIDIFGIWAIFRLSRNQENLKKEYRQLLAESEERLSHREYAETLRDLGFDVPRKYLR